MKQKLIGREQEVRLLREYLNTDKSEFVAVYGRRRVGKTYLIRQVLGDEACFSMTGMENGIEAFYQLQGFLENLPEGRKIVFIDELPWMFTLEESGRYFKAYGFGYGEKEIAECWQALGISGIRSRACCWSSKGDDSHRGGRGFG